MVIEHRYRCIVIDIDYSQIFHRFIHGWALRLGLFHVLPIVDNAAVNMKGADLSSDGDFIFSFTL